jgi:diguanylate cyclase (GGDEF)-like protein
MADRDANERASKRGRDRRRQARVSAALVRSIERLQRGRPLEPPGVKERIAPFVVVAILAMALALFLPADQRGTETLIATLLIPPLVASAFVVPWQRLPRWTQAIPPLLYFVVVALVRDAQGGELFTPLVVLPVIWFALYGTRPQLVAGILGAALTIAAPIALIGGEQYPADDLVRVALYALLLGILGFTISELVRERELLLHELSLLARTDFLTGLANRRAWREELGRALARAHRDRNPICVAILDLDHFKAYNDERGHAAGDRLLEDVSARWVDQLRETDMLARYGGEEFAVALPGAKLRDAGAVIARLREATPDGETASGGVAEWNFEESADELLGRADRALYEAKRAGRDRVVLAAGPPAPERPAHADRGRGRRLSSTAR